MKFSMKYLVFFIIFISLYSALNYYVGKTILLTIDRYTSISHKWYWIIFFIIASSYCFVMLLNKYLPNSINQFFQTIGSYWLIILMYSLLLFPLVQIINLTFRSFSVSESFINKLLFTETISLTLILFSSLIIGNFNTKNSYINNYDISNSKVISSSSLNIVMVSDLHLGTILGNKFLSRMINEINNLNPDVVLIAGDIVDSNLKPFLDSNMAAEFSKLNSKYGTYAALGNHDLMVNDVNRLVSELESNNVKILRNEAVLVNDDFYIIGRDDIFIDRLHEKRNTLSDIIKDIDNSKLAIVIDHTPSSINDSLENNIDLHFSGHTHKGQIFPGNFITSRIFEIDHGHLSKENLDVFVSSGYGTWGPRIRLGSKSEIVNVLVSGNTQ